MLQDADLGKIDFIVNARARRIKVRILPEALSVTLPVRSNEAEAMAFINSVRQKLIVRQTEIRRKKERNGVIISEEKPLETLTFRVEIRRRKRENVFFTLKDGVLIIEVPLESDCSESRMQAAFWNGIGYFLRKEAKKILPQQVAFLAGKHNFSFSSVKIQSSKSRWGSCSSRKTINLSFYLLLLPQHLIDYVILHELCHTKEMNHSAKFWEWMDRVTGNKAQELNNELKQYSMPAP
ncbi:MAG: M48 family metallopeptidase [Prevotellaceae bacterium]|jgi:predicted metal-dependent hydrolase|nr:M48 family metallopeptidase [Prevotellaceae bacterium]